MGGEGGGALSRDKSIVEVDLGIGRKKISGWKADTDRRAAVKGSECGV